MLGGCTAYLPHNGGSWVRLARSADPWRQWLADISDSMPNKYQRKREADTRRGRAAQESHWAYVTTSSDEHTQSLRARVSNDFDFDLWFHDLHDIR